MTITNEDCMAMMARYPDGYFDLAIVDPPYGIGEDGSKNSKRTGGRAKAKDYKAFAGNDKEPPPLAYFIELKRVSKHQIIWGANHFIERIPNANSSCWIVWDKDTYAQDFADCELAYTSFKSHTKYFKYNWCGFRQGPSNTIVEHRIHPTQKPTSLYRFLLDRYAAPIQAKLNRPMRILDTHLGSGSIAIACHDYGYDLTACELDPDYYAAAMKRINNHMAQQRLF